MQYLGARRTLLHRHITVVAPSNPVLSFIGEVAATNGGGFMTASTVPIGSASASRRVIVAVSYDNGTSPSVVSSATIGGVSAVVNVAADDTIQSNSGVAIFSAIVPTGTTATIVANGPSTAGIFAVYTVDNSTLTSGTPTTGSSVYAGTNLTTMTTSLTASAGGFVITAWNSSGGTHSPYITPSATQDFTSADTAVFSQTGISAGAITPTITITGGGVSWAMASASWR